jgi:hypothetical protein
MRARLMAKRMLARRVVMMVRKRAKMEKACEEEGGKACSDG